MEQRTLLNFDVKDPFDAMTVAEFKDRFKRLNGRFPNASELNRFYEGHPKELERRQGSGARDIRSR